MKVVPLLFIFGIFISCPFYHKKCDEPENFFGNKVRFEKYDSQKYFSNDSSRYNVYQFSFLEDSSFSYLRIWHQNTVESTVIQDTTIMLNGKFKISKDSDFPWYVIELDADFIYEKKIKDTLDGILRFTDFNENEFSGFEMSYFTNKANIFTNTDRGSLFLKDSLDKTAITDSCFTLYVKFPVTPIDSYCAYEHKGYWLLEKYNTFCLQQPEQISTGDSL
jgi:hypothetical protein